MRIRLFDRCQDWGRRGIELGAGSGIATGYASLGLIGVEGRMDYAAIGSGTNRAPRLCSQAHHGQILVTDRMFNAVQSLVEAEGMGHISLKSFHRPQPLFNMIELRQSDHKKNFRLIP